MKPKHALRSLLGLMLLLGIFMAACGERESGDQTPAVEDRIPFSELPDPGDYALIMADLPSIFESDYWERIDKESQEDESLGAKWYTVSYEYTCLRCASPFEGAIKNRVQVNQTIVTPEWFPEEPSWTTADNVPVNWQPVSADHVVGDFTKVWFGTKENLPEETYCYLMFSKNNVLVYLAGIWFPEDLCYVLLYDFAATIEARLPD